MKNQTKKYLYFGMTILLLVGILVSANLSLKVSGKNNTAYVGQTFVNTVLNFFSLGDSNCSISSVNFSCPTNASVGCYCGGGLLGLSGVLWQYPDPNQNLNFADAENYCTNLGDGWKIPSLYDLSSINFGGSKDLFKQNFYWSNWPVSGIGENATFVIKDLLSVWPLHGSNLAPTICVKDPGIKVLGSIPEFPELKDLDGDGFLEIFSCGQLQSIYGDGLSSNDYELIDNIDCSDTQYWNNGEGFIPIVGSKGVSSISFSGPNSNTSGIQDLDGDGYFEISSCGQLQSIKDFDLSGNYKLTDNIDCYNTKNWNDGEGFIPIGYSLYNADTGWVERGIPFTGTFNGNHKTISGLYINRPNSDDVGLFGMVSGANIYSLSINDFDITGKVGVGGLVGEVYTLTDAVSNPLSEPSSINEVYVSGTIHSDADGGGLAGSNGISNIISNSYSTANVYYVTNPIHGFYNGGLVGSNYGRVINSYSTGYVANPPSGGSGSGGLAANGYPGIYENAYWDVEASGQPVGDYTYGIGLTTTEMKTPSSFSAWDTNIWNLVDGSYPTLKLLEIETLLPFSRLFNGNGYTISNLSINRPTESNIGLFGYSTGHIFNVGLINANINGADYVGGLVGKASGGTITNSYSTGQVIGDSYVGGLVGLLNSVILNSYSTVVVSGLSYTDGGLTGGLSESGMISYSYWDINISGRANSNSKEGKTTTEMKTPSTFSTWDTNIWNLVVGAYPTFKLLNSTTTSTTTPPTIIAPKSDKSEITKLTTDLYVSSSIIDPTSNIITVNVNDDANVTSIKTVVSVSDKAKLEATSGTVVSNGVNTNEFTVSNQNLTNQTYKVIAEDGTSQTYTIRIVYPPTVIITTLNVGSSPATVWEGKTANIIWKPIGAKTCTSFGGYSTWPGSLNATDGEHIWTTGALPVNKTIVLGTEVSAKTEYIYGVTCSNDTKTIIATTTVTVIPDLYPSGYAGNTPGRMSTALNTAGVTLGSNERAYLLYRDSYYYYTNQSQIAHIASCPTGQGYRVCVEDYNDGTYNHVLIGVK
jgi:hypothetical protein